MELTEIGKDKLNRTLQLAEDMSGYIHHSGYPVYDGGHTEPEETCEHVDCKAVRDTAALFRMELL